MRGFSFLLGVAAGNSFATFQTPFGTSPVADSANDTLTLTSTGGTITITGDATTDTINFEASVLAPGSNTEVIFNDSGALGADPGFTFNKTTDTLALVGVFDIGQVTTNALIMGDVSGNTRGTEAIDITTERNAVTQVASGTNAINIGRRNTSGGHSSTVLGQSNTIDKGAQSVTIGYLNALNGTGSTSHGNNNVMIGQLNNFLIAGANNAQSNQIVGVSNSVTGAQNGVFGILNTIGDGTLQNAQLCYFVGANNDTQNGVTRAFVFGVDNIVNAQSTSVIGDLNLIANSVSTAQNIFVLGTANVVQDSVADSIIIGAINTVQNFGVLNAQLGTNNVISNNCSTNVQLGNNNTIGDNGSYVVQLGQNIVGSTGLQNDVIIGFSCTVDDSYSIVIGDQCVASGAGSNNTVVGYQCQSINASGNTTIIGASNSASQGNQCAMVGVANSINTAASAYQLGEFNQSRNGAQRTLQVGHYNDIDGFADYSYQFGYGLINNNPHLFCFQYGVNGVAGQDACHEFYSDTGSLRVRIDDISTTPTAPQERFTVFEQNVTVVTDGYCYEMPSNTTISPAFNPAMGKATLLGGAVTVNTGIIRADSVVIVTRATAGTGGELRVDPASFNVGLNFTITSSSGTDNGEVFWVIFNPSN